MEEIKLLGKVVIKGIIEAKTGLRIGGSTVGLDIGGVDNPAIKNAEGKPYIPGSSLKGKMRSLLEKAEGLASDDKRVWLVKPDKKGEKGISIHLCNDENCPVCNIFGRTNGEFNKIDYSKPDKVSNEKIKITNTTPTRLIVRDAELIEDSITEEMKKNLDLEYTEVKFENSIDRITSAANPRQNERVPAGAQFEFEMIYNVFNEQDKENLREVFKAMKLLEDDYLGSSGSRGYGKVEFKDVKIYWNSIKDYERGKLNEKRIYEMGDRTLKDLLNDFEEIKSQISG